LCILALQIHCAFIHTHMRARTCAMCMRGWVCAFSRTVTCRSAMTCRVIARVFESRDLRDVAKVHKLSPYVEMSVGERAPRMRGTVAVGAGPNVDWQGEIFQLDVPAAAMGEPLLVSVMHKTAMGGDRVIGTVHIELAGLLAAGGAECFLPLTPGPGQIRMCADALPGVMCACVRRGQCGRVCA
jgi:hypothetical protein